MSVLVLIFAGYGWLTYRTLVTHVNVIDAIPAPISTPEVAASTSLKAEGKSQNILLVGNDDRTGANSDELNAMHTTDDGGGVLTDTMMVLHVPAGGSKAVGISLPRDSWVDVPGHGMNKLNAAYSLGVSDGGSAGAGARLLITTIQNITGLHIDHYVAVSLLGFFRIAEALGPINVCLNQAAHDPYSGTDLPAGESRLNAIDALAFVRQRHNLARGDIDRQARQQYFLSTELHKMTGAGVLLNVFKLNSLIGKVSSQLTMDPGLDPLKFAQQMQGLTDGSVRYATIPFTGYPSIYPGGVETSIVSLDWNAIPAFVSKAVGYPSSYVDAKAADPASVNVDVIDGTKTRTRGADAVAAFSALGFHASAAHTGFVTPTQEGSANYTTLTTVTYPAGMAAQARAVSHAITPTPAVVESQQVTTVTVTFGSDGRNVRATSTGSAAAADAPVTRAFTSADCIN